VGFEVIDGGVLKFWKYVEEAEFGLGQLMLRKFLNFIF